MFKDAKYQTAPQNVNLGVLGMNSKSRAMRLKMRSLKSVRKIFPSPTCTLILLHYGTEILGENSIATFTMSGGIFIL